MLSRTFDRQFTPANTEDGPYVPTHDCPSNTPPRRDAPTLRSVSHSTPLRAIAGVTALDELQPDRLLTPEDVADLLQVDRETIYRMARRGELPAIKVARHWRFRAERLDRWLADLETGNARAS
jgi:excisionase family DNA binding protein